MLKVAGGHNCLPIGGRVRDILPPSKKKKSSHLTSLIILSCGATAVLVFQCDCLAVWGEDREIPRVNRLEHGMAALPGPWLREGDRGVGSGGRRAEKMQAVLAGDVLQQVVSGGGVEGRA